MSLSEAKHIIQLIFKLYSPFLIWLEHEKVKKLQNNQFKKLIKDLRNKTSHPKDNIEKFKNLLPELIDIYTIFGIDLKDKLKKEIRNKIKWNKTKTNIDEMKHLICNSKGDDKECCQLFYEILTLFVEISNSERRNCESDLNLETGRNYQTLFVDVRKSERRNCESDLNLETSKNYQTLFVDVRNSERRNCESDLNLETSKNYQTLFFDVRKSERRNCESDLNLETSKNYKYSLSDIKRKVALTKLIYEYCIPIIFWCEDVKFDSAKNSLLFQIAYETRNWICHYKFATDDGVSHYQNILKNIIVIFMAFGIDLMKHKNNIRTSLQDVKLRNDLLEDVHLIIGTKDHPHNKDYIKFGKFLHDLVSTKIQSGYLITRIFKDKMKLFQWFTWENRFIQKENNDETFQIVHKFCSPFFIFDELKKKLNGPELLESNAFNKQIEDITRSIHSLINNDPDIAVSTVLPTMQAVYKLFDAPVPDSLEQDPLHNRGSISLQIQKSTIYIQIFRKLVEYTVSNRITGECAFSFIFNYYYAKDRNPKKCISDRIKTKAKNLDIFRFSSVIYTWLALVGKSDNEFYKQIESLRESVSEYLLSHLLEDLDNILDDNCNHIVNTMKEIFEKFSLISGSIGIGEMIEGNKLFIKLLHYHIATWRNVEEKIGEQFVDTHLSSRPKHSDLEGFHFDSDS